MFPNIHAKPDINHLTEKVHFRGKSSLAVLSILLHRHTLFLYVTSGYVNKECVQAVEGFTTVRSFSREAHPLNLTSKHS